MNLAERLASVVEPFLGGPLPVRLRAWDGTEAGDPAGPLVELRSPAAVRRLLRHPGELGAAQAYVTGELDVPQQDGWDLDSALTYSFQVARERSSSRSSQRVCVRPRTPPSPVVSSLAVFGSFALRMSRTNRSSIGPMCSTR